MLSLAGAFLQDNARAEKYGSKTLTIMKIDPIAEAAQKNLLLKSFVEMGAVALNSNTLVVGNVRLREGSGGCIGRQRTN